MVTVIPELDKQNEKISDYVPNEEEQKRGIRIHARIDEMLKARQPYENGMKRGLQLYDGIHLLDPTNTHLTNDNVVAPFARIFVEAKTAEEVKAFSEYQFAAVEDAGDSWKVELLKEVNTHVRRVVKQKAKRHQLIRLKNITGVSIARVGYRRIMGMRKIRTGTDEHGDILTWKEVPVPIYDDLFMDVISPLNFAIDPNCTTMDDAMDCVHFHAENFEVFHEIYANDPKFKNTDKVSPGKHGRYGQQGFTHGFFRSQAAQENMVVITEYFNKIRDEWVIYANGIEIYYGPLPDDHKELPFVSYHNNATFCTGYVEATITSTEGQDIAFNPVVRAEESFWTQGDPQTIMDLIELRTAHGRAAHRAIKRASQVIIATEGSLPVNRRWMDGDIAKGMKGKIEVMPLGTAQSGNWQWAFDDLFQLMRLAVGIDPSNLAESKQKTATEAEIQWETSMRRLDQNIEYNEENGEIRLGVLFHKLIQQRYTRPEIARLTGAESEEEIGRFDEIEKDEETGIPLYGKRYRRIKTSFSIVEDKRYKNKLSRSDAGISSFIARPEYIRTSDIDIQVQSGRRAGQIRAIEFEKGLRLLDTIARLLPLAQGDPMTGQPGLISMEDLPSIKAAVSKILQGMDMNPETDIGQGGGKKQSEVQKKAEALMKQELNRSPITNVSPSA